MFPGAPVVAAAMSLGIAACGDGEQISKLCAEVRTAELVRGAQCGMTLDFIPINDYQGELSAIQDREGAVVLVNGSCTGTLIAAEAGPVVLTAGHCVGLGDQALLVFNFEANADGDPLITNGTVIEQSTEPDYALIELDQLPAIEPTLLTTRTSDRLVIIQHPRGRPKVLAEGDFADACNKLIFYTDLDTLVGSSGAGVLNHDGTLLGIHTDGDCAEDGSGSNQGWTGASIVDASAYLQDVDIADR